MATKTSISLPAMKRASTKTSQYDFASLRAGTDDCIVETDVVKAATVHGRLTSAVVAYRKRTGDKSKFTVRTFQIDGKDAVGVWKMEDAPAADAPAADAPAA